MELLVAGRKGSGKTTSIEILFEYYQKPEPLVITEIKTFNELIYYYNKETKVLLIDTNPVLAYSRLPKEECLKISEEGVLMEDFVVKYLTELDGIHIISNNLEMANLRLKLKRLAKTL